MMVNNPCIVTNLPPFQFHIVLFPCKQAPEHDHWVLHLKRAFFGIWFIEQGIFIARLVWFMAYRTRNIYCWGVLASLYGLHGSYLRSVNSPRVRNLEKNSGETVCRLGTIIQSIFCAQSGASIRLTVWKWSGKGRYPWALPPMLENFRRTFSLGPTYCPWVSEDV